MWQGLTKLKKKGQGTTAQKGTNPAKCQVPAPAGRSRYSLHKRGRAFFLT